MVILEVGVGRNTISRSMHNAIKLLLKSHHLNSIRNILTLLRCLRPILIFQRIYISNAISQTVGQFRSLKKLLAILLQISCLIWSYRKYLAKWPSVKIFECYLRKFLIPIFGMLLLAIPAKMPKASVCLVSTFNKHFMSRF